MEREDGEKGRKGRGEKLAGAQENLAKERGKKE